MGEFYKKFGIFFGFFVFIYYFLFIFMLPSAFRMFIDTLKRAVKE
ncbi:MAG: hypothetical protein ACOCWO_02790 [Candidatus Muiribacteriaceae bacterium]